MESKANKGILLVEDCSNDAESTLRAIQMHTSHEVIVVRDGAEALDFLFGTGRYETRNLTINPILILLDLCLPKASGFEVLRQIRKHDNTCRIPVIILSGSTRESDIRQCYALGANSFICKRQNYNQSMEDIKLLLTYWLAINTLPPATD
jgi:two-component system, response regulator